MNEKLKVQKSCVNCFHFYLDGKNAVCFVHNQSMPIPDSPDSPDYGYCSDYVYECYHCTNKCCPKNPEAVKFV